MGLFYKSLTSKFRNKFAYDRLLVKTVCDIELEQKKQLAKLWFFIYLKFTPHLWQFTFFCFSSILFCD